MLRQLQQGFDKQLTVKVTRDGEVASTSLPPLTDADYEFLFNQLLEGVAHGWHPPRIAKFFQRLGDRGQQQQWVAWLERFSTKILTFSHAHEQQLGARMMRLGQLAESTASIQQVGVAAYQIGHKLFYGNTFDSVWEYEGPDLPITDKEQNPLAETASQFLIEEDGEDTLIQDEIAPNQLIIQFAPAPVALDPLSEAKNDTTIKSEISEKKQLSQKEPEISEQMIVANFSEPHSTLLANNLPATETTEAIDLNNLELIESWFNLGLKQASSGDFAGAIESWEQVLRLNPHICEAWHNRGSALGRIKKYQEAIESFDKALAINPKNYQAWSDRAHALSQLQKWSEAIASWDKAIEIAPGDYHFWYNRGWALEKLQYPEESIASYEKALEIKPDFQQARSRYIKLLADKSQ
jgi:tetratricopeptide (TPR) repeat protein